MNWTEPTPPTDSIWYDHVILETPIGKFKIEWKGHKEDPDYTMYLVNEQGSEAYLGTEYGLDKAKDFVKKWMQSKHEELTKFLFVNVIEK